MIEDKDIVSKYEHSKIGNLCFNITAKVTKVLVKQRWLYYLLLFTWGIIMAIVAGLVAGVLAFVNLFTKNMEFKKYKGVLEIRFLKNWGGMDLGLVYVRDITSAESVSNHEVGHSYEIPWMGPLFPFAVAIPSAIRWWIRRLQPNKQHKPYDSAWFESAASECGEYAAKNLK